MQKGKVKFFCACSKELWQDLDVISKDHLTITMAEQTAICSDCLTKDYDKEHGIILEHEKIHDIGGEA